MALFVGAISQMIQEEMKMSERRKSEIRAELAIIRKEMRDRGIKRMSCFNGGHTPESMRYNETMFRLNAELNKATKC